MGWGGFLIHPSMHPHHKRFVPDLPLVGFPTLDVRLGGNEGDTFDTSAQVLQQQPDDEPRVRRAETEVRARAEGKMRVRLSVKADLIGLNKRRGISVRGRPAERHAAFGRHLLTLHIRGFGANPTDVRKRRDHTQELLARQHRAAWILPQKNERLGMLRQIRDDR